MEESCVLADARLMAGCLRDGWPLTKKEGRKGISWKCPEALWGRLDHSLVPWASLRSVVTRKGNAKGGFRN